MQKDSFKGIKSFTIWITCIKVILSVYLDEMNLNLKIIR